jgi:hypothetical protein
MNLERVIEGEDRLAEFEADCNVDAYCVSENDYRDFISLLHKSDKVEVWNCTYAEAEYTGFDFTEFRFFDTTKSDKLFQVKIMPCP